MLSSCNYLLLSIMNVNVPNVDPLKMKAVHAQALSLYQRREDGGQHGVAEELFVQQCLEEWEEGENVTYLVESRVLSNQMQCCGTPSLPQVRMISSRRTSAGSQETEANSELFSLAH